MLFTVIEGEGLGSHTLVLEGGERHGDGVPEEAIGQAEELIRGHREPRSSRSASTRVFAEVYGPPPSLLVYGAVDTAEAMSRPPSCSAGAIVADARAKFATPSGIPSADEISSSGPRRRWLASRPITRRPSSF